MAKSSRRRKLDRSKREIRISQQRLAAQRRQATDQQFHLVLERYERILDPATPIGELAALIAEHYSGQPVFARLAGLMLATGSSPDRLAEVAQAVLAREAGTALNDSEADDAHGSPSLTALTFCAAAASATGDMPTARQLLDQAMTAATDQDTRIELMRHIRLSGRTADAIELLEARLRDAPDDDHAAEHYGGTIEEAYVHVNDDEPGRPCPCGLAASWQECCGPRESAALDRFADRSGMIALRETIGAYLTGSDFGRAVDAQVDEWLSYANELDWQPADLAAYGELAADAALLTAGRSADDDEPGDDADCPLTAVAADPATPAELAARATTWHDHLHYGLWRIGDPRAAPGLWCTDLISGLTRYVEFPPSIVSDMPRWTVWLGGVVPVDGVWRSTGTGLGLSPAEADAAAELVLEATASVVYDIAGKPRKRQSPRMAEPIRIGSAEPRGVYVDFDDPVPRDLAALYGKVTGALLPRIVNEVHDYRSAPPALRNSDGDPMCLITARVSVSDGELAARRLAGRPDFEADADDKARLVWYGQSIPAAERAAMLAEALAQVRAAGYQDAELEQADGQRWIRGFLYIRGDEILAEVNSASRLARLTEILARLGMNPAVTDEKRIDPAQDLAWGASQHALPGGAAPAAEGWEKHWLDESVPALRGRTPRHAAQGKERPLLEALLRQFEYQADLLAVAGTSGIDTGWLRQELDMADDPD